MGFSRAFTHGAFVTGHELTAFRFPHGFGRTLWVGLPFAILSFERDGLRTLAAMDV
jgi:hypothetical protein